MTTSTTPQVDQRQVIAERIRKFVQEGLNRPISEDDPDIFYPSSDGKPLAESKLQFTPLTETVHVLEHRYRDRADVFVAGNLLLYYRMNDNEVRVAPDVMVVFGYDPAAGTWLRNLDEAEEALAESNRQSEAQAARIRELEALVRQQGIEPPGPSA